MTQQHILPSPIIKMDNALARAKWPDGGKADLDLVMHIASKIRADDEDFQTYSFAASELGFGDKLDGKTYRRIRGALDRLASGFITVEKERGNFYNFSLFSMSGYEDGIIVVRFDPGLKPFFLHLSKNFTSFELFEMRLLPSEYSKRLFLLLKSYYSLGEVEIDINKLHEKLHTPESQRKDFAQFRLRVLDKSQKDLKSFLLFEWEPVKKARRVVAIKFSFGKSLKAVQETKRQQQQIKESARNNKRAVAAYQCAKAKAALGGCSRDNKPKICETCKDLGMLAEILTNRQKKHSVLQSNTK